ncbi:endonuclease/exonuclease/phosphatase family protein [Muricoccus pecuniae]|uniref:Endonuclease/exonuclease/phosphatase family metal-dependent hydrolase n=1 Tax=Muricoccus pecuniae TaxID=693023 RepID=A0A840Y717_9PROT|nr:endonuclease/exonuclease/phosphatase family protein [Roseomonas pecuniae]MBB5694559.1 endonuclease/exonuclease/phosphatase family metal-dependent hydrolase [Roseomonas pecuniae]
MIPPLAQQATRREPFPRVMAELRGRLSAPPVLHHGPVPEGAITVASYNVHKCVGTDKRFDPARVAEVIAELDADILALQEADRRFGRRVGLLDMAGIERRTGLRLVPLSVIPQGHGWHGNALLVRGGHAVRVRRLSLPGGEPRGAVMVDLEMPAGPMRVVAAHFGLLRRHRSRQVDAILDSLSGEDHVPTVMLGDLNEWRPGRRSSLRALEGSFGTARPGPATFPSRMPILSLDRILARPHSLICGLQAHDSPLARIASDHLPLKARLDLAAAQDAMAASLAAAA